MMIADVAPAPERMVVGDDYDDATGSARAHCTAMIKAIPVTERERKGSSVVAVVASAVAFAVLVVAVVHWSRVALSVCAMIFVP